MHDIILESKYNYYNEQAKRVIELLKSKHRSVNIEGRQYPQIITCLNAVYKKEHTDEELMNMITDGSGDGGLADAFVFRKDSIDIFDFKEGANLGLRNIQQLKNRLDALIINKPASFSSNDICLIKDHLKKYHSTRNTRSKLNIYIVRKKFAEFSSDIKKEMNVIEKNPGMKVIKLTNKRIVDLLLEQDFLKKWPINKSLIELLSEKAIHRNSGQLDYLIIKLPLNKLLSLYNLHIKNNKDLFAQNIRLPQKQKKLKTDLSSTIEKYPDNFFIFHNGITITASNIFADITTYTICDPQVVNGAQTIGNLHEQYKNNTENRKLKNAKVICKIIKADQELTDLVCETSNTQRAVKIENLRVNDSFQKKLEIYIMSESIGKYEYIRKGKKKNQKSIGIKYTKFFQWAYSVFFHEPAKAKNAKKMLFEKDDRGEYNEIKRLIEHNIDKIITLCDTGVFVEKRIAREKNKDKKGLLKSADLHIIAALFSLHSIAVNDFNRIYRILKEYSDREIKKGKNPNYIFTKTDLTWKYLNRKI